jgi:hypothetical protein
MIATANRANPHVPCVHSPLYCTSILKKETPKLALGDREPKMPLSVPNPAHGDWAKSDEWALSARISEPLRQITVGWGGRIRTSASQNEIHVDLQPQLLGQEPAHEGL